MQYNSKVWEIVDNSVKRHVIAGYSCFESEFEQGLMSERLVQVKYIYKPSAGKYMTIACDVLCNTIIGLTLQKMGAAIAQWIRQRLPSCVSRFKS